MKHLFVFDLSALMSEGEIALPLVSAVAKNCHKIAIEYGEVWEAYKQRWAQFDIAIGKLLWGMLNNLAKFQLVQGLQELSWEGQIKEEDRKFVRLAHSSGAILVTEDQPLVDTLSDKARHGIKVMKSLEALQLAEET